MNNDDVAMFFPSFHFKRQNATKQQINTLFKRALLRINGNCSEKSDDIMAFNEFSIKSKSIMKPSCHRLSSYHIHAYATMKQEEKNVFFFFTTK